MTIQESLDKIERLKTELTLAQAELEQNQKAACKRIMVGVNFDNQDPFTEDPFVFAKPSAEAGRFKLEFQGITEEHARAAVLAVWPEAGKADEQ